MNHSTDEVWTTTFTGQAPSDDGLSDYVIVFLKADGEESAVDAIAMLTQTDRTTGRTRAVLAGARLSTGELVAAPDWPGFTRVAPRWLWSPR